MGERGSVSVSGNWFDTITVFGLHDFVHGFASVRGDWTHDGKTLAGLNNGKIALLDRESKKVVRTFSTGGQAMSWSPDDKTLAVATGANVKLFKPGAADPTGEFKGPPRKEATIRALAWSADRKTLAAATNEKAVVLWDIASGQLRELPRGVHQSEIATLCWLDEGKTLATGSATETCVWDAAAGKLVRTVPGRGDAIAPRKGLIAAGEESGVRLRSLADGSLLRTVLFLRDNQHVNISPEGHFRGSEGVEKELVYVALTEQGEQLTLTPEEFSKKYGWKNDPAKLLPKAEGDSHPSATRQRGDRP